jgi:hypothetical protein
MRWSVYVLQEHPAPDVEARTGDEQHYADGFGRFCKRCRYCAPPSSPHLTAPLLSPLPFPP